jgi:DNA-binding response OmpR family regulator
MKKTILVVDDDFQIRDSLRKVLQQEGYEVEMAADGHEGAEKAQKDPVDLVLLDLSLPGSDGWDTFERLTAMNPLMPIIMITGRQNQADLAEAAGVGALMMKPLDVPWMLRTITKLLAEEPEKRLSRLVGLGSTLHRAPA